MDLKAKLAELARLTRAGAPVVSVYLNTRWADEHQRDRVRVFLRNEVSRSREAGRAAAADLDWVEAEGHLLVSQARFPDAHGVALFACRAAGLRQVIPLRAAFEDTFVVAEAPYLVPLAAAAAAVSPAVVAFVDAERARLIRLEPEGPAEEVTLESEVPGHHRRGGWAQMAQSRYQRHIQDHRGRHFEAVAEALARLVDAGGAGRIVLAGEPRNLAVFRGQLPTRIAQRVVGQISGARHEPPSVLVSRAAPLLENLEAQRESVDLDATLTLAAKGGQAVAGVERTLEAANRGAVHRLFLLRAFAARGGTCLGCGTLQTKASGACRLCGKSLEAVDLAAALAERVLATGGEVERVDIHQPLAQAGGVAALLRYPL
ncbi:MAG TPA: Vms1/Ankzf1 family peptidyl-tRNA hydrolase [Methylomirabilota bacterium]|nr:Vms1/Ankzf1 family peptidyl-tRNA hydrolase [Methylomirabilota bacterium]